MRITKYGHCCLLIEVGGICILTDPGNYSRDFTTLKGITVVLITHEHTDHLHLDSLKLVMQQNPSARIICNKSVAKLLEEQGFSPDIVGEDQKVEVRGVCIAGFGHTHAEIYKTLTPVENTSYLIAGRLFYPGDAFYRPNQPVDILALPVAGPWMKISEAVEYALELKPRICFPVHDGMLKQPEFMVRLFNKLIPEAGTQMISLEHAEPVDFT